MTTQSLLLFLMMMITFSSMRPLSFSWFSSSSSLFAGAGNSVIINNIIRSRMIRISDVGDVRWGESLALAFRCREFDSSLRHRQSISTSSRDGGRQRDSLPRFEAAYRRKVSSMAHRHRVSPMTPGHDTYLSPCQDVT